MKTRFRVVRSAVVLAAVLLFSTTESAFAQSPAPAGARKIPPANEAEAALSSDGISPQVADAEAAIVKSDWKTAEAKLDAWVATHPADGRALFDAGYVADAQNRLDDAVGLYRRATVAVPQSLEAHLSLGLLLARQDKLDEARPELEAATKLDPGPAGPELKARAWRALAQIDKPTQSHPGDAALASEELLEALKVSPETPADTLLAANLAEDSGQYEEAEAAYRRILAKDPTSAGANAGLAHTLIAQKQYPEAETFLRAALAKSPNDAVLNAQLAMVLASQDKAEALPLVESLHAAHPEDAAITRMLAQVRATAGDPVSSDKLYLSLLSKNPEDPELLIAHGQNLIRQLKYAEAFTTFDKATKIDPGNGDAWGALAFAASKTGQPAVALHALTMRSKFLPEVPSTYFLWATSYDTMHDKEHAVVYYHHFLDASAGKFPDQEWQAKQRLLLLEKKGK
jgi:tetratricopeptide (TPR) repeat protein